MKYLTLRLLAPVAASAVIAGLSACGEQSVPRASESTAATSPSASATADVPAGFATHGFPTVAATSHVDAGQAATVHAGGITVTIPVGAIASASTFQLLTGDTATFQRLAPNGQKILAAFAFRVIDDTTHQLIVKFGAPVVVAVDDPAVTAGSVYENVNPTDPLTIVANPVAPKINGTVLSHGNVGAGVGWVVASPSNG